ncbi:MAG TPA: DUF1906 domain-containing protein [Solirubrobacterales bacterium]|nr:DUF1906 domain-containing protein [Solirubrobacterales bacterium]
MIPIDRRAIRALLVPATALALLTACFPAAPASAAPAASGPARTLRYAGRTVHVPAGWPVFRLARQPGICVRLDRRAVYLGSPSPNQSCPAGAIGRRRAIVVEPAGRARAATLSRSLTRPRASASAGGSVFTGLGFDACSAPSSRTMAAWAASPFRAIGVYIGGDNRACSQPNLTASWVAAETEAGWHLIPTYVGLQAPTSSCSSCAKLSSSQATAQGTAQAVEAVAQAGPIGIGPGSPIYFDMEAYTRTSSATAATLAFLEAWTNKLHALGYLSGVYSSSSSGIADLAGALGSGYAEPDDLWIANWNGSQTTTDPVVPASAWTPHARIHQYQGGHNETYGGQTINIDSDYVDAAMVGTATLALGDDDPIGFLDLTGSPAPGTLRVKGWAFDPNAPTAALGVRVFVGGRAGAPGAQEYELGPIAGRSRRDLAAKYPQAGARHGFDASFPTVKSGRQPVCVYAVDLEPGADRLLGCEATAIPVAITLANVRQTAAGVRVRISCAWPAGTACPGQLMLRSSFKLATPRGHGRPPRIRLVTRSLGRRGFGLTGGRSHAYLVPFSAGGRRLLREHGALRTQLVAAIPGGRRTATLRLGG